MRTDFVTNLNCEDWEDILSIVRMRGEEHWGGNEKLKTSESVWNHKNKNPLNESFFVKPMLSI